MPKTFDCFTLFNELDLLEIRFNILDPYVDYFVLAESRQTFSGKEKPLYYEENKKRFAKWDHKIIHIVAPNIETPIAFERHYLCYDLLEAKVKELGQPEDVAYFSDLDEVWKPQDVQDGIYNLTQLNYTYYLNNRSSEVWEGTLATKVKNLTPNFNKIYRSAKQTVLPDGGWHFQNLGGPDQIRKKLEAYDHTEFNLDFIKEDVEYRMENNEDYIGRPIDWKGIPFTYWIDEVDLPQYLKDNKSTWAHLFRS